MAYTTHVEGLPSLRVCGVLSIPFHLRSLAYRFQRERETSTWGPVPSDPTSLL